MVAAVPLFQHFKRTIWITRHYQSDHSEVPWITSTVKNTITEVLPESLQEFSQKFTSEIQEKMESNFEEVQSCAKQVREMKPAILAMSKII